MMVELYAWKDTPPRIFATGALYMLCELNARNRKETDEALRALRLRRRGPWKPTALGYEAKLRFDTGTTRRDEG